MKRTCCWIPAAVVLGAAIMIVRAATPAFAAAPISWQSRGIGAGGGMYSPVISPLDTDVMFLGVDMSQMMRTTNGGALWSTVDFAQLQARQITEVQFTSTPGVLYSGDNRRNADETSLTRPVKSTDQGTTWVPFSQWPPTPNTLTTGVFSDPNRDDTFIVCTGNALFFYKNSGTTGAFTPVWTFAASTGRVGGTFWRGNEIWIGTNEGLLYSGNGGQSFSATLSPGNPRIASFCGGYDPTNNVLRFHAVTTLYNLRATDFPNTYSHSPSNRVWRIDWTAASPAWTDVTGDIPSADHVQLVGMAKNNPDVVYAAASRTGSYPDNCAVWRVTGMGTNWTGIFFIPGNSNILTGWGGINSRANFGGLQFETKITYNAPCGFTVHALDANRLIVCDNALIHLSTNATASSPVWEQMYCVKDNPGHDPGQRFASGQFYAGKGMEATV
ncbi:MAG TPA: hypothetical protein VK968_11450, partial [Roseimicrobium sp.]|nr:hypothetical protein [Roseimicrobium sp.]